MSDPTEKEIEAMYKASDMAGEYLDSLKKTDLATMTEDEWMTLIEVIVTSYTDEMRGVVDDSDVPF